MYPLLYQVWSTANEEELQPLVEWWAGRHSRSMVSIGFLGAHQYRSASDGRRPLCNFYELPDMDVFGADYHAATLADLEFLETPGDKYKASTAQDLQHLATSGSTATIYEQVEVYGPNGGFERTTNSLTAALTAPCVSVYGFGADTDSEAAAWFESNFLAGPPSGCAPYMNIRLARRHSEQHPISPLPTEEHELLVLVQWPNRAAGEVSDPTIRRVIEDVSSKDRAAPTSNLLVNGVSRLNESGWALSGLSRVAELRSVVGDTHKAALEAGRQEGRVAPTEEA